MSQARIIDGKGFAEGLRATLAQEVAALKSTHGVTPGLATVLVGDQPASATYVRNKIRASAAIGVRSTNHHLPQEIEESDLLHLIARLNADDTIDGILVQLPLPENIDPQRIIDAIDPAKDADGLTAHNMGRLLAGTPQVIPCTPQGCELLLADVRPEIAGARAVVIGRSTLVGKPLALLLLARHATVTLAHSRTRDLPGLAREADILVAAMGRPQLIKGDWVKPGAIVIDVGINRIANPDGSTRLVGDVAFEEAVNVAGAITPVPGGVGPMTVTCLLRNTIALCRRRHRLPAVAA